MTQSKRTAATEIVLVRHAWAGEVFLNWWRDPPLRPQGRAQATALARQLAGQKFAALYASPLTRARETADIIGRRLGLEPRIDPALRECEPRVIVGINALIVASLLGLPFRDGALFGLPLPGPGARRRARLVQRVGDALRRIAARHPGERVLVVSHGGAIRAGLIAFLPERASALWVCRTDHCHPIRLVLGDRPRVIWPGDV